jgi:CBS domain-containing protein
VRFFSVLIIVWSLYYNWDSSSFTILMSNVREKGVLSEIMSTKTVTVGIDEYVEEALRLMVKFDVGSVIVIDGSKPVGIVTERDVTRASLRGDLLLKLPVRSLMSRPLQTASPSTEIWRAFELMLKLGVRRLPLVEGGMLVGMVTEKDLTRWVLQVFYEPNLPPEIKGLVENRQIEALTGRSKCPNCGYLQDECICVRTALGQEE